jgi:CBS domain-containing protein
LGFRNADHRESSTFRLRNFGWGMFDLPVKSVMERAKLLKASPETPVRQAAKLMAQKNVGAVIIVDDDRLVGIFTERDVLVRVVAKGLNAETTTLANVMTPAPETIDPGQSFGYAMLVMQEHGFRHLPVVQDGKPVGIVSARSALDPALEDFVAEEQRRKHLRVKR